MWPGEQPGGQQYPQYPPHPPQDPQQPRWQQPQPGYGYPPPQQGCPPQPAPQWGPPVPSGGPEGPRPPGRWNALTVGVAVVAAASVVAAAVVGGVYLSGDDDGKDPAAQGPGTPTAGTAATSDSPAPTATASGGGFTDAPRGAPEEEVEPVIAGWQAVTRYDYGLAYDVPQDWAVASETLLTGYTSDDKETMVMGGSASYKEGWCGENSERGLVGAKGDKGASSLAEAAENNAYNWAYTKYLDSGAELDVTDAEPFKNAQGLTGYAAVATATGVSTGGCNSNGVVYTVSVAGEDKLSRTWSLVLDTGYDGALDTATIEKMRDSIRLIG